MNRLYIILILLTMAVSVSAQTKADADNLYKAEKYTEAAAAYEKLLKGDKVSANLYYNLGNAYYKLDNIPLAVLNYERAYLLDPGDGDVCANLNLARTKTIDKVSAPSEMFFVTWWHSLLNSMGAHAWSIFAIVCFVVMLIGILAYAFAPQLIVKKIGIYSAFVLFMAIVIANIAAYSQNKAYTDRNTAIVMAPAVSVKSSPNDSSTDLFIMHEGSKVEILDSTMKEWIEVKFDESKQGWVHKSAVVVI